MQAIDGICGEAGYPVAGSSTKARVVRPLARDRHLEARCVRVARIDQHIVFFGYDHRGHHGDQAALLIGPGAAPIGSRGAVGDTIPAGAIAWAQALARLPRTMWMRSRSLSL